MKALGRTGVENATLYESQAWFYKVHKRSGNLGHIKLRHLKILLYQHRTPYVYSLYELR